MKKILPILGIIGIFTIIFLVNTRGATANPSQIYETKTAASTSTISYMTQGTATTTLIADSQSDGGQVYDSATLMVQFTATSTLSQVAMRFEYANQTFNGGQFVDCTTNPTACDWYSNKTSLLASSTSGSGNIASVDGGTVWTFASSSQSCTNGLAVSSNNRGCMAFSLPVPSRYVRAVFTIPPTASPGGVWAVIVAKREQR